MVSIHQRLAISLMLLGFASCAFAEGRKSDRSTAPASPPAILTGKERLGPKWSDEQRIDNCKIPLDKRGTKPRPSAARTIRRADRPPQAMSGDTPPCCPLWMAEGATPKHFRNTRLKCDELEKPQENATSVIVFPACASSSWRQF